MIRGGSDFFNPPGPSPYLMCFFFFLGQIFKAKSSAKGTKDFCEKNLHQSHQILRGKKFLNSHILTIYGFPNIRGFLKFCPWPD